jgi:hypothetical protein
MSGSVTNGDTPSIFERDVRGSFLMGHIGVATS